MRRRDETVETVGMLAVLVCVLWACLTGAVWQFIPVLLALATFALVTRR